MKAYVRRVAFNAGVYYIWQERNRWIFSQIPVNAERVIYKINACAKSKLINEGNLNAAEVNWSSWTCVCSVF